MASVAVRYNEFTELNTEVLAINVDSVVAHKVWHETELSKMVGGSIPYPMLSDETGSIGRLYDTYDTNTGKTLRGTLIIDPEGIIHMEELLENGIGRNPSEMIRLIKAVQHSLATGDVMPCSWQEGDKTLQPKIQVAGHTWEQWQPN